jgi:predicted amidohydrolase YtcJ
MLSLLVSMVLINGNVVTLDKKTPKASAVAVRDGKIVAVGSDAQIKKLIGPETKVIDLKGKTLVPGLTDSHLHLVNLGVSLVRIDLADSKNEDDAAALVKSQAGRFTSEWIRGRKWDQNKWPSKKFPTAESLDKVVKDRPVSLTRVDGHAIWVNSKAMELAGVDDKTQDPPGGKIIRDGAGHPTGVFLDKAMDLVAKKIPKLSRSEIEQALQGSFQQLLSFGLTTVHDAGVDPDTYEVLQSMAKEKKLPLRIYVLIDGSNKEWVTHWLDVGPQIEKENPYLTVRGFKLFADGALGSRGAALTRPYSDDPHNTGLMQYTQKEIADFSKRALKAGFQVATHAIGDKANNVVLNAYEEAFQTNTKSTDPRFRVEHAQILDPKDIGRFKKLGVIASMQGTHCTSDMPWVHDRIGVKRAEGAYAWRSLLRAGVKIANGSDAPVESANPILGYYASVTRQDVTGKPPGGWHPNQRMTPMEALRSFTLDAAYSSFEEDLKGSIEVGKLADFTVLSDNILNISNSRLPAVKADMTIVGGTVVYQR